ncbi:outer membrane protein assembly factor [Chitinophaga filiformis]|uniref:BamA/TamA family outer membrane protein n=1 Tax=Chitinophaga filiformis TaxID=104663 RepID=UPI001F3822E9|nr:BamA/TamA family outer membrane protein [Chitinophaga filiformis]MCF6406358.1 outer membrane protein assembly factor [Chitinophaga filiformis]
MKKVTLIIILFLALPACLIAQRRDDDQDEDTVPRKDVIDLFKGVIHYKPKPPKKIGKRRIYYSLLPSASSMPGGGVALITSTNAAFYLGPRRTTNLSNVSFTPSFSFKGRFSFALRSNIWLEGNMYNMVGDMRFIINPQYTWGMGNGVPDEQKQLLGNNYLRFYETFYRKVRPKWLVGVGYHMDWHSNIGIRDNDSLTLSKFVSYKYGTDVSQTVSSGISLNLLKDSRQNSINPQAGHYFNAVFRINPTFLGSNDNWESLYLDYRKYIHFGDERQQNVLAFWGFYWTTLSRKTPYLDLPSIGWDPNTRSGRGIDQNRFRGKGLINLEAEYRRDITKNGLLGFVVFVNANTVTQADNYRFTGLHPATGAGLRIKFNKRSGTNIAFDYGVSKYGSTFSLNLGEAF